jgi:hypothetical protein
MDGHRTRIEIFDLDQEGNRQIRSNRRTFELLSDRREDVEAAISETASLLANSFEAVPSGKNLSIRSIEGVFGLSLSAEAGAIISKVSGSASIEIKIVMERGS